MTILFIPVVVHAQTVVYNGTFRKQNIANLVQVMEDPTGKLGIGEVSSAAYRAKFHDSRQNVLHFGFSTSPQWIHFRLYNTTDHDLVLEVAHAFLPYTDFYSFDSAGILQSFEAGYRVPMGKKIIKYHTQAFPLPAGRSEVYIRLLSYNQPVPLRIWEANAFELAAKRQTILYGLYAGILMFVVVTNLFLFYAFRKFYYLHYALLVVFYLATAAAVMEGFILYLFPNADLMAWYTAIPALNMPVFLSYSLSFLEVKNYSPKSWRTGFWFLIYFTLYLGWMHFLPSLTVIIVNQVHALALFLLVTIISIRVGRKGNRLGYYFALAYCIWLILVGLEMLYIQIGIPPYILGLSHVSIAIFAEVSILAYLLALRFMWERKEEQRLRFEAESHLERVRQNFTQEILKARLEIQENTFNNIGQEIHDNIGQTLTLAKLNLSTLDWENPNELKAKTKDAKDQVSRAIVDLRDLSHTLNGDMVHSMGFSKAIANELEMIRKAGGPEVVLVQIGEVIEAGPQNELILFRIFQEALQNILRHSAATRMMVKLIYEKHLLTLLVKDDGQGFDPAYKREGNGISNMSSRSALLGATLMIDSEPGEGTTIQIKLPLK